MPSPHVLILYNAPTLPPNHPDAHAEYDILKTAHEVEAALLSARFHVSMLALGRNPQLLLTTLAQDRPDVVFNLFEGNPDEGDTEAYVAGLLQWLKVPFTGSPLQALPLARDKIRTKHLLRGAGLPTADFLIVPHLPVPACQLTWPVIVKPALQDASIGIDHDSVVSDQRHLEERVQYLFKSYGPPVLVEEYIAGRELNVALWETDGELRCSVGEVLFRTRGPGFWPIVTYASKWHPGSDDDVLTPPEYPSNLSPELHDRIGGLARAAFRLVGCRDYARVDFRVRGDEPFILEVNPNPAINDEDGFANCLQAAGVGHAEFLVQLVRTALARR
jgi:D-alanine-D-alanine ligase